MWSRSILLPPSDKESLRLLLQNSGLPAVKPVEEFIYPWRGVKVNSGIRLSYWPASHVVWRAGTTTLCRNWLYPTVRDLWIPQQESVLRSRLRHSFGCLCGRSILCIFGFFKESTQVPVNKRTSRWVGASNRHTLAKDPRVWNFFDGSNGLPCSLCTVLSLVDICIHLQIYRNLFRYEV